MSHKSIDPAIKEYINAKFEVLEKELKQFILDSIMVSESKTDKKMENNTQLVSIRPQLQKEWRRDMILYVNKEICPQIHDLTTEVRHMKIENDGVELVTEYRRRLNSEVNSTGEDSNVQMPVKRIGTGNDKKDFQRNTFFFNDDD